MPAVDELRGRLPDATRDTRLNLQSVLQAVPPLSAAQRWGVAIASALAARHRPLADAVLADARAAGTGEDVVADATAAASLMAMNNVYYRFRHMVGKAVYSTKPARLRMNRLVQPATDKPTFELMALAVSAINGCEACLTAHEREILDGGFTEDHVHEAVRIAATMHAAAIALEAAEIVAPPGLAAAG